MKTVKKLLSIILMSVILASLFAGCGAAVNKNDQETSKAQTTAQNSAAVETTAQPSPVEITWWDYPNFFVPGKENGIYENEIAADFMKENPNIKVNVEMQAWDGGPEKVNMAIASNSMPDMLMDYPGRITGYAAKGVLAPLDEYISDAEKSDIPQAIWNQCIYNGKIYQYPTGTLPIGIGVNKTLFESIGALNLIPLDKPDRAWTIEEFEAALAAVKEKAKDIAPIVFYAKNQFGDSSIRMLIQSGFNTDLVDKDLKKVIINNDTGYKGLQWIFDIYKKGLVAKGAETLSSSDAVDMFTQGKSAMCIIYGSTIMSSVRASMKDGKAKKFDDVVIPFPHPAGTDPKVAIEVNTTCIFDNKDVNKVKAAAKLNYYMWYSDKYARVNVKSTGTMAARSSLTGIYGDDPEMKVFESMVKYNAETGYESPNYAELRSLWYPMLQGVLIGQLDPKEALDKFAADATAALSK